MNRRHFQAIVAMGVASLTACAPPDEESVESVEQSIINGELDTVNQAVVALFSDTGACSGTILHAQNGAACILTAAHCFGSGPLKYAIRGNDYENPDQVLQISSYETHPLYNDKDSTYDFALVKAKFAADNVPQILPMSPAEDTLKVGSTIEHSGYGLVSVPNGSTTKRHRSFGKVSELYATQFTYNQPNSGPCSGDSGGPQLVDTPNGKRVVGVTSYGDQDCASFGVSGRVSSFFKSFIVPFCGELPNSTGSSSSAATSSAASTSASTSTSTSTSGAGGASSSSAGVSTSGAGGADVTTGAGANDLWTAGDLGKIEHSGDIVTTSCTVTSSSTSAARDGVWLLGFAAAVASLRRSERRAGRFAR